MPSIGSGRVDHQYCGAGGRARQADRLQSVPSQAHELKAGEALIEGDSIDVSIANRASDGDWLLDKLGERDSGM